MFKPVLLFCASSLVGPVAYAEALSKCTDARPAGVCADIVRTGINVCEDNQNEKPMTAKMLREAQETKFNRATNFSKLAAKYRKASKSAKSDAQKQKLCVRAERALRRDCNRLCNDNDSCDDGKAELKKLEGFCAMNEMSAEEIAAMAAKDAALFEDRAGAGSEAANGNGIPGANGLVVPEDLQKNKGYAIDDAAITNQRGLDGNGGSVNAGGNTGSDDAHDNAGSGSGNDTNNAGSGSGYSGAAGAGLSGGSADGSGSNARTGTGLTNSPDTGEGSRTGGTGSGAAASSGSGASLPGYMIWGTPTRNKKPKSKYQSLR